MDQVTVLTVATIVGTIIGAILNRWPDFKTRAIPGVLFGMAVLKNVLVGAGLLPQQAALLPAHLGDGSGYALAGVTPMLLWTIVLLILGSWFEMTAAVGSYSAVKNLAQARKDPLPIISKQRRPRRKR